MKNFEAQELLKDLKKLNDLTGFSFLMAMSDVSELLEKEKKALEKCREPSDEYKKYQKEIQEMNSKFAKKDAAGNPKTKVVEIGGISVQVYDMDDSLEDEKVIALDKLEKKNKALIAIQKEKQKVFEEELQKDSTLKPIDINKKEMPKGINGGQMIIARKFLTIKK